jgi:GH25 family lysozyme M1 (1,4-beta-N-acetylmuramidase)
MKYIDVSTWQRDIDWEKVKATGIDGVIIRAGFGSSTLDNKFIRNIEACNRLDIPCGVYWFSYALNEDMVKKEAEYCLKAIEPYRVELPVCFDFEYDSVNYAKRQGVKITKELATKIVHAFCGTIEDAGYYVMNYANPDYLKNYFDESVLKYDLWLAYYPPKPNIEEKPRKECGIWQYTSSGNVGGISGGVKYITSDPGLNQRLKVQHLTLSEATVEELNSRFCLIYTGQRRLARNLLRDVVGRYVGNEPESLYALNEIQRVAALMRFELERGNVDEFARLLEHHWELSQKVDAASTNTLIDQIFASINDLIDGRLACGAGGGGFLQVVLKKGVSRHQVHDRLKEVFQDNPVDTWPCSFV